MQFADGPSIAFRSPGTQHREGQIEFRYLLKGQAGSPQNYELSLVRTQGRFYGPPHRHNFDQIRWVLSGSVGEPGKLVVRSGEVGYYPEGTPYQIDSGDAEVLLLQFGGASGNGFTHYDQLRAYYPKLAELGEFTEGLFRWHNPPASKAKQQDGYEALWEAINRRPLVYPQQRYRHPTVMNPEGFAWLPCPDSKLERRELGRFTERAITIAQLRLSAGEKARIESPHSIRLLYVLEGSGKADDHTLRPGCAFEVITNQYADIEAHQSLVLVDLHLPRFNPNEITLAQQQPQEEALA